MDKGTETPEARRAARPPGEPVLVHCTFCGQDVSERVSMLSIVLPCPGPGGEIRFAPQSVLALPLICPHCKEPQMYQSGVRIIKGGLA